MKTLVSTFAALAFATPALASEPAKNDPQSPGWYLAPFFSFVATDDQRGTGNGKGFQLAIGHHGEVASIELAGVFSSMSKDNAQLAGGQLALVVGPIVDQEFLARFYGVFAIGAVSESNIRGLGYKDGSGLIGDLGVGYRQPMPIQGHAVNLRAEARYRADFQMPPRDANEPTYFRDLVFNVGIEIPLSSPPPPPPPPPPPQVVPPVAPAGSPADSTTQPANPTAQPAGQSDAPAASESGAPAQPSPNP
jgi:hypothetical protein